MTRTVLCPGPAALALILSATAVQAQQTSEPRSADEGARGLEEVVVTAQRREESLQKASVALDVLSGQTLLESGVTSASELAAMVPALTVTEGGGINNQIYLRGVGNRANNDYLDPAVIVTYDGVALARGSGSSVSAFYDIERVEVLKGPQGTLYGRNATGGVVNVIPVAPRIGEYEGYGGVSFGNFSDVNVQGALNLPAGERNAFRISASSSNRDGYNRDGTNDAERWSARAQWLSQLTETLKFRLAADYTDVGGIGNGTTPVGRYQSTGLGSYTFVPSGLADNEGSATPAATPTARPS